MYECAGTGAAAKLCMLAEPLSSFATKLANGGAAVWTDTTVANDEKAGFATGEDCIKYVEGSNFKY